ncbi:hypothetical protein DENSPDRAFT_886002 [Dentipellis sp. KUC8613]|nr:hypothetical protein DENSPDRAFT_886002 [Dentipellis sp. KUC8613]
MCIVHPAAHPRPDPPHTPALLMHAQPSYALTPLSRLIAHFSPLFRLSRALAPLPRPLHSCSSRPCAFVLVLPVSRLPSSRPRIIAPVPHPHTLVAPAAPMYPSTGAPSSRGRPTVNGSHQRMPATPSLVPPPPSHAVAALPLVSLAPPPLALTSLSRAAQRCYFVAVTPRLPRCRPVGRLAPRSTVSTPISPMLCPAARVVHCSTGLVCVEPCDVVFAARSPLLAPRSAFRPPRGAAVAPSRPSRSPFNLRLTFFAPRGAVLRTAASPSLCPAPLAAYPSHHPHAAITRRRAPRRRYLTLLPGALDRHPPGHAPLAPRSAVVRHGTAVAPPQYRHPPSHAP